MKKFFGDYKFYKMILLLALPIMFQQLITALVSLIDNIMIGSVGDIALTSVTVANKPFIIFQSLMFGVSGAAGIFIAQFYGAKNHEKAQRSFDINIIMALSIAAILTLLFFLVPQNIIELFTKTPTIVKNAMTYIKVMRFAFIPYAISLTCMMSLRNVGIVKVQLGASTTAVIINTFLNYCLIFGNFGFPKLGIQGAAIATLVARVIEMVLYIIILNRNNYFIKIKIKEIFQPEMMLFKRIIQRGYPVIVNEVAWSLGTSLIFLSYLRCDEYMVAAISVVDTVANLMFVFFGGLSSAVAICIGANLGANKIEEAKDNSYKLIGFSVILTSLVAIIVFVITPYIPLLYNLSPDINNAIIKCIHIRCITIIPAGISLTVFFTLRAGGDTKNTLLLDSGFLWCGGVLVSTILSIYTNISLVNLYACVELLEILKLAVSLRFYNKGKWLKNITEG